MYELRLLEYGSDEYEKSVDIRDEVFRKPWGLNIRDDDLTVDAHMDLFGVYVEDKIIGTIALKNVDGKTVQIKSVALRPEWQGKGIGKSIMLDAEKMARERNYNRIYLTARVSVLPFYEKLGYKVISEPFNIHVIPHVEMEKFL